MDWPGLSVEGGPGANFRTLSGGPNDDDDPTLITSSFGSWEGGVVETTLVDTGFGESDTYSGKEVPALGAWVQPSRQSLGRG